MSTLKYTREQYLAINGDRHLSVTANAGSGKTRVLVEKYLGLLLDPYKKLEPKDILAITFTKKAAAEMQMRAVNEINAKYQSTGSDEEKLRLYSKLREKLTYSNISTIHSFCSNLIREYPIETGVSPNFTEIDALDEMRIVSQSIDLCVDAWLQDPDKVTDIKYLYSMLGIENVEIFLSTLLKNRQLKDYFGDNYLIKYRKTIKAAIKLLIKDIYSDLKALNKVLKNAVPNTANRVKIVNTVVSVTNSFLENVNPDFDYDLKDIQQMLTDYKTAKKGVITAEARVNRSNITPIISESDVEYLESHFKNELLNEIAKNYDGDIEMIFERLVDTLYCLFIDVDELIEEEKLELGGINFDDMLLKANSLLSNENIAAQVRSGYKYLLVDEFQDTNDLQYDIICKLVPSLKAATPNQSDPILFIVGDAKQSIYGFRDADVSVFNKAKADINRVNQKLINNGHISEEIRTKIACKCTDQEKLGSIELNATFRLLPVVGAWVNEVCGKLMIDGEYDFQVKYNEFTIAREGDKLKNLKDTAAEELGSIDFLIAEKVNDDYTEEHVLVANYIQNVVLKGTKTSNEGENYTYKDIGILVRKKNVIIELANEFIRQGIPFIINNGQGFYETQEIRDIISYLNFIINPNDDISFAALLRSYFFGLSHNYLYRIAKESKGNSFYDKFCNFVKNNPDDKTVESVYRVLTDLIPNYLSSTISEMIINMIESSNWHYLVSQSTAKKQIKANVEKLLNMARAYESRGFKDKFDFANELKILSESSDEQEADFANDVDAVNIMTMHSAKGLEFPIAILYKANAGAGGNDNLLVDKEFGISFNINEFTDDGESIIKNPLISILSKHISKKKGDAEERRLLYVAMTRAKDHLVISATLNYSGKTNPKINGFYKLLSECGLFNIDELEWFDGKAQVILQSKLNYLDNNNVKEKQFNFPVNFFKVVEAIESDNISNSINIADTKFLLEEIPFEINSEIFSASKFMSFNYDRREYINRYFLGLPNSIAEFNSDKIAAVENLDSHLSSLEGTIVHKTLENMTRWLSPVGEINEHELISYISTCLNNVERSDRMKLSEKVFEQCSKVARTEFIIGNYWALENAEYEFELTLPIGNHYLTGSFDVLLKNKIGEFEIWDWKTNETSDDRRLRSLISRYKVQMKVYAYLLSLYYPKQKSYKASLLFTKADKNNWVHTLKWSEEELKDFHSEVETIIESIMSIY